MRQHIVSMLTNTHYHKHGTTTNKQKYADFSSSKFTEVRALQEGDNELTDWNYMYKTHENTRREN